MIEAIAARAIADSPVWAGMVRTPVEGAPVFGPVAGPPFDRGLETIYEAYLVHHGRGRAFAPSDRDGRVLLGDYLYAAGLVDIAAAEDVEAVATLATLISLTAHARAEGGDLEDDGRLWLAAARRLAGARNGTWAAACDALRRHDPSPLRALVPLDEGASRLLERHAARLSGVAA